ncbi:MAG: hypothetical protein JOY82_23790 [Streptosporangiaceae bacterium]|nr:hypothetical protein [Streptosporangiaceae bacterium]MBV9857506.1 hypothetical protein [Streptosporangiaceae bacterium]
MAGPGLAWLGQGPVPRTSFCVTFIRGMTREEVLARFGADPGEASPRTLDEQMAAESSWHEGYGPFVRVGRCDGWLFAWEEASYEGVRPEVLRRVPDGGEAVVVRHALDAFAEFGYAAAGAVVSHLVTIPPYTRKGSDPDRFLPLLRDVGLDFAAQAQYDAGGGPVLGDLESVLTVAGRAFGLSLSPRQVEGPWPSARILPRLEDLPAPDPDWQFSIGDLVIDPLVRQAPPRTVASLLADQSRLLLEQTRLARYPELAAAVRAAAGGRRHVVTDTEPLGVALRRLCRERYEAEQDALPGSAAGWITPEERHARAARAEAVRPLRMAMAEGGSRALGEVLMHRKRWAGPGWREQVLTGLAGGGVPPEPR